MARQKIVSDFRPDFNRIKTYDRKYINLPHDTVTSSEFLSLPGAYHKVFLVLGVLSFERAETSGWFPATMKELEERTCLSVNTIRDAKRELEKLHFLDVGLAFRINSNVHYSDCYRINGFKEFSTSQKS